MPSAQQGDIRDYDFGPVIGAELSGRRPALIISNNEFNRSHRTAIALPMSRTMPAGRYRTRQHVYAACTGSCASTRQIKPVHQRRLGATWVKHRPMNWMTPLNHWPDGSPGLTAPERWPLPTDSCP